MYNSFVKGWIEQYKTIFGQTGKISEKMISQICRIQDCKHLGEVWQFAQTAGVNAHTAIMHRKMWEWLYIAQALEERNLLTEGKRGLGFACGKEPLVSLFAEKGCKIVATDCPADVESANSWKNTNQHSDDLDDLFFSDITSRETLDKNVKFQFADMKNIPRDFTGFDFVWSSCAMEHLGSIYAAKNFAVEAMKCLKPGGVAVHTTEINIRSSIETIMTGGVVPLRTIDFIDIFEHLVWQGHKVEPLDFRLGNSDEEYKFADSENPSEISQPHFKLKLAKTLLTSFGMIIYKKD
jgi:2-polyprenyl-3-methyl-5-hydroxy-6-metoxy-1,4-benzoquinol methylase